MSKPLFVGSYLQVPWRVSANEKEEKGASDDNNPYFTVISQLLSKKNY